jgi:hypothetical protein
MRKRVQQILGEDCEAVLEYASIKSVGSQVSIGLIARYSLTVRKSDRVLRFFRKLMIGQLVGIFVDESNVVRVRRINGQ